MTMKKNLGLGCALLGAIGTTTAANAAEQNSDFQKFKGQIQPEIVKQRVVHCHYHQIDQNWGVSESRFEKLETYWQHE